MDRPCGIGGVAMGAWGIVGGPFKVIPTAIEISIRHHGVTTKGWNGCFGSDSVDTRNPKFVDRQGLRGIRATP